MPVTPVQLQDPRSTWSPGVPADISKHIPSHSLFLKYPVLWLPTRLCRVFSCPCVFVQAVPSLWIIPLSPLSIYIFLFNACLSLKFPLKYHFFYVAFLLNTESVASLISPNIYFTSACTSQYYICLFFPSYPPTPKTFTYEVLMVSNFVLTYGASIVSRTQYAFHRCLNLVWIFKG